MKAVGLEVYLLLHLLLLIDDGNSARLYGVLPESETAAEIVLLNRLRVGGCGMRRP